MPDARKVREWDQTLVRSAASVSVGEIYQLPTGEAAYLDEADAQSSGTDVDFRTSGKVTVTKTTSMVFLDGGRVYWDHSANSAHYKKVNDRDFYIGRAVGDWASADASMVVDLNKDPPYDIDAARDPHITVIVGTQGLNTMGVFRRGGGHKMIMSTANEAQKMDILSRDGFAKGANAIIEGAFIVVAGGAAAEPDFNIGVANGTHATDADSITESIFIHVDGNSTNINAESDDGTTEVAATDTTLDYTAGTAVAQRVEFWMDMRNPADVQIYINGANVLPSTVFGVDASAGPWFLLAHLEKTSSATVFEVEIEWLRARFMEQALNGT